MKREHSSVGSERLPYKQRVGGSTPSAPTKKRFRKLSRFFLYNRPRTPGPLLPGGISRASQDGVSKKRRTEMPDGINDAIGMPLGAVAKRLGVEGKTMACHRRGFDSLCSHQKAIQETESLFSYYPPQTPRPSATRRH